jgi:hypothetical protein
MLASLGMARSRALVRLPSPSLLHHRPSLIARFLFLILPLSFLPSLPSPSLPSLPSLASTLLFSTAPNLVQGRLEEKNGVYEGEFEHGFKKGKGKMAFSDGGVYDGMWLQDRKHGTGTLFSPTDSFCVKYGIIFGVFSGFFFFVMVERQNVF